MKKIAGLLMLLVLVVVPVTAVAAQSVHRVQVGGPDACAAFGLAPGCDANLSLVAVEYADGSVSGQYTDRSVNTGIHAVIDCLVVVGNDAWISGWVTQGTAYGEDVSGQPIATRVRDNGTSTNDPVDQISFSVIGFREGRPYQFAPCTDQPDYPLFDVPQGQVNIS